MQMQRKISSGIDAESGLKIGGFVPLSACDYPGELAAVIFCQGCPWRCRYCHNPHLQAADTGQELDFAEFTDFLKSRSGLIDALVFSGGEPTYQRQIIEACKMARQMGYKIALHTAAPSIHILEELLPYLSWLGLDIKTEKADYASITGVCGSGLQAFDAIDLLLDSAIEFEIRTTIHPLLHKERGIVRLAEELAAKGVKNYNLQCFKNGSCSDPELRAKINWEANGWSLSRLSEKLKTLFPAFSLRN